MSKPFSYLVPPQATTSSNEIQLKSKAVEEMLAPLILQVSTLQKYVPGRYKHSKLRSIPKLIKIVNKAADNFIATAEQIASKNPQHKEQLLLACNEVRSSSINLQSAVHGYSEDTLDRRRRGGMEAAAGALLRSVTRLLVLVDIIDVSNLFRASDKLENALKGLRTVKTWDNFVKAMQDIGDQVHTSTETAVARQRETRSNKAKQLLVSAHTELSQCNTMLITATKAFLEHRNDHSIQENRDYVIDRMTDALRSLALLAEGQDPGAISAQEVTPSPVPSLVSSPSTSRITPLTVTPGNLANNITDFETMLEMSAGSLPPVEAPQKLQAGLEKIMAAASFLADSESTRDQHMLVAQCDVVRQKLQDLLTVMAEPTLTENEAEDEEERHGKGDGMDEGGAESGIKESVCAVEEETATLRSELRRAMIDHVSDTFVDPCIPMKRMVEAAKNGGKREVEECAVQFISHAEKLIRV